MVSPPTPLDPERLLAEDQFVRGLARHLLRDAHGAEDLAQQTWVAALQQPDLPPASLRGWLATVVRRLAGRRARSERRERARQLAAARADEVPSTAEIVAREVLRAEVVQAVLALEEPYRATVLLRWFENLPPRAVARRLSVPVETVRTRLKRAMAQLRTRLDARTDGGRPAWCALLLPFAKSPAAPLAAVATAVHGTITGVLFMTTKTKVAAILTTIGGILLVTLWAVLGPPAEPAQLQPPPTSVQRETAPLSPRAEPAATVAAVEARSDRQAVGVPAAPTTGSLLVHVIWGDDKQPAAGVLVEAYRGGDDGLFENLRATSDASGTVKFDEISPGRVWAVVQRGDSDWGQQRQIVAGQQLEVTVEVAAGLNAKGVVVDSKDRPIAGADVLVTGWTGGEALSLTRTAADGTFYLRNISTHCHIGACAAGYGPSPMRQFTASKGAEVEFRIVLADAGVALSGVVLDSRDRPVANAVVQAGSPEQKMHTLADGGNAIGPQAQRVHTDAAGRFQFASVESGKLPLSVRARGLAPWHQDVDLETGRPNEVTVRLLPGVTLVGTVHDAAGVTVGKAGINIGAWGDLGRRSLHSDAGGAFHVDGLAPGELAIRVESDQHGKTEAKLQAVAGETLHYDAVLTQGLQIRGRVLDVDGKPVAKAMVEVHLGWLAYDNTDDQGRFTLKNCPPGKSFELQVRRKGMFPEARVPHVEPGAEEVVIRLPKEAWVWIQGKVLGPDGKALPSVHVMPFMKGGGGSPAETADATTGEFKYGPYAPGDYSMHLQADGFPPIRVPFHTIAPDEVWDLGTLQFQRGGTLVVNLITAAAGVIPGQSLTIYDATGENVDDVQVEDGTGKSRPLPPGSYSLQIAGKGIASMMQPFDVRAEVETRLDVPVQQGIATAIECSLPAGADRDAAVDVVVKDHGGAVVMRGNAWSREGPMQMSLSLLPGDYRVEARRNGLRGETTLVVTAPGPAAARLELAPQ